MGEAGPATTLDYMLGGRLALYQSMNGHRAGTDSMLLAAAAPATSGMLVDLGAGAGTAGLAAMVAGSCKQLVMLEIQPHLVELARRNIAANGLADCADVICVDALSAAARRLAGAGNGIADALICNPPYLEAARSQTSPDPCRARAHSLDADGGGLEGWLRAASALLRPGGQVAMIHRADALDRLLRAAERRFGGIEIIPVYPRTGEPATRVLLKGVRGSRAPMAIRPGIVLHEADGSFTPEAAAIHAGEKQIWALRGQA